MRIDPVSLEEPRQRITNTRNLLDKVNENPGPPSHGGVPSAVSVPSQSEQ